MARTYEPPHTIDIPTVDVATFVFRARTQNVRRQPQYFDAGIPSRCFSLEQAEVVVKKFAKGLLNIGLRADDKVMLYSGNNLCFPVLFWGTVASGCVCTGCSPGASVNELAYQLFDSGAKVLFTDSQCVSSALLAAKQVGIPQGRVFEFCDPFSPTSMQGLQPWTAIWAPAESIGSWHWPTFATEDEAQSKTATINYSSGTGMPKGVEISHYNLVSNSLQVIFKRDMVTNTPEARARKERIQSSGERWLAPLPMFHAYGQAYYAITAARCGVKVFIMSKYDPWKYLLHLDTYRITFLTGVPTLLVGLSKHPEARKFNLKAIESVRGRGEAGLVLTECTCSATGFAQDDVDDGTSIGWLNPNVYTRIVPVPDQQFVSGPETSRLVGEIWLSGPNIMQGYHKRPKETADTIVHEEGRRWLRTGDIGYADERGRFYIIDRLKELIKVKGLQVAPAEVEQTLMSHPGVIDCAVVGLKRADCEYPKAYVVKKNISVTGVELQKYIEERLSKHKWLTGGVSFIETIPRTASGKVIRRALPQKEKIASLRR